MVPALTFSIFSLRTSSCSDCRLSSALQKGSRWKLLSLSAFKKRQMVTKPIDFGFPPSPALTGWRQQRSDRVFQPPAPGPSFSHFLRGKFSSPKDRSLPGNISRSDVRFTQSIDSFHVFFHMLFSGYQRHFIPPREKTEKKPCHCLQTLQFFRSLTCQGLSEWSFKHDGKIPDYSCWPWYNRRFSKIKVTNHPNLWTPLPSFRYRPGTQLDVRQTWSTNFVNQWLQTRPRHFSSCNDRDQQHLKTLNLWKSWRVWVNQLPFFLPAAGSCSPFQHRIRKRIHAGLELDSEMTPSETPNRMRNIEHNCNVV